MNPSLYDDDHLIATAHQQVNELTSTAMERELLARFE
jgi:hypothetical protein